MSVLSIAVAEKTRAFISSSGNLNMAGRQPKNGGGMLYSSSPLSALLAKYAHVSLHSTGTSKLCEEKGAPWGEGGGFYPATFLVAFITCSCQLLHVSF